MTPQDYGDLQHWILNITLPVHDQDLGCLVLVHQYISKDWRLCQDVDLWTDADGIPHIVGRRYYPNGTRIIDAETDRALLAQVPADNEEAYYDYLNCREQWPRYKTIHEALNALEEQIQRVGETATLGGCRGCGRVTALIPDVSVDGSQHYRCEYCDTRDPYQPEEAL